MALKYQAMNGTVINKTTVIQGMDLAKGGSPNFLRSIRDVEGNEYTFVGIGAYDSSEATTLRDGSLNVGLSNIKTKEYIIDNIKYVGHNSSSMYFMNWNGTSTTLTSRFKGILTIVKAGDNGITTYEQNIDTTLEIPLTSYNKGLILRIEKTSNEIILSVTFKPTE